jgi:hypothetical protein
VSRNFIVIHEAKGDFTTATELADRVSVGEIDWLDETLLESQRTWIGEDSPGNRLTWKSIPHRAREIGIRVHGHFNGEPALPDANATRRAIVYVLRQFETVDAILLIRDMDDQTERRAGLEQARTVFRHLNIIIGVAVSERECWIISGFDPINSDEEQKLALERQKLGFDPCSCSHELTACKNDQAKRSPKRVLQVLTDNNWERQQRCWKTTCLAVLKDRGRDNGLADYLKEIKDYLVPVIIG